MGGRAGAGPREPVMVMLSAGERHGFDQSIDLPDEPSRTHGTHPRQRGGKGSADGPGGFGRGRLERYGAAGASAGAAAARKHAAVSRARRGSRSSSARKQEEAEEEKSNSRPQERQHVGAGGGRRRQLGSFEWNRARRAWQQQTLLAGLPPHACLLALFETV